MTITDDVLQAYLDGELAGDAAARVEAELRASPALRRREAELRALLGDCVDFFSLVDDAGQAPVAVRPALRVEDGGAAARPAAPARPVAAAGWSWRSPALRAAAILLMLGGVGTVIGRQLALAPDDGAIGAPPGAPDVVATAPGGEVRPATPPAMPTTTDDPPAAVPAPPVPRPAPGGGTVTPPATPAGAGTLEISAPALRMVAAIDRPGRDGGLPAGQRTYELSSGTRIELTYGERMTAEATPVPTRAELLAAVDADERAAAAAAPGARPPSGVSALDRSGRPIPAGEAARCPHPVAWRDPSGIEIRVAGPLPCSRLRAIAAGMTVTPRDR